MDHDGGQRQIDPVADLLEDPLLVLEVEPHDPGVPEDLRLLQPPPHSGGHVPEGEIGGVIVVLVGHVGIYRAVRAVKTAKAVGR